MLREYALYKAAHRLACCVSRGAQALKVALFQLQRKALVYTPFIRVNLLCPVLARSIVHAVPPVL
nr:MAG TPA: hypothetical protein [Caudoviricetes sp.]DAO71134.1 MAG TPA: hypothetical protein [Caudoviricetes sp.]